MIEVECEVIVSAEGFLSVMMQMFVHYRDEAYKGVWQGAVSRV